MELWRHFVVAKALPILRKAFFSGFVERCACLASLTQRLDQKREFSNSNLQIVYFNLRTGANQMTGGDSRQDASTESSPRKSRANHAWAKSGNSALQCVPVGGARFVLGPN